MEAHNKKRTQKWWIIDEKSVHGMDFYASRFNYYAQFKKTLKGALNCALNNVFIHYVYSFCITNSKSKILHIHINWHEIRTHATTTIIEIWMI